MAGSNDALEECEGNNDIDVVFLDESMPGITGLETLARIKDSYPNLPVVLLTTTGARTGLPRTAPLVGIPIEGSLGLIGSNFGGPSHPGWVHNLTAEPRAKLRYRLTEVDVVTELADAERRDEVWATAIRMYAGYAGYRAKAGRDIRVFVARPV